MGISKEKIIEASIYILNRDGAVGLTMRSLAKELDIKAASLYWHIKDKNELYNLIVENICEKIKTSASPDEPKKYLYEVSSKFRARLLETKDSVEIFIQSSPLAPQRLALTNSIIDCLSKIGVKNENLLTSCNMLNHYVLSFVADEILFKSAPSSDIELIGDKFGKWNAKSIFYYEAQFIYGLEVLFAGFRSISPSK